MLMVCPNEGKLQALRFLFGLDLVGTMQIDLFKNDYTPVDGSVLANFDPCDFTGYFEWTINPADWDNPNITADVGIIPTLVVPAFTCTGGAPQNAYGWVLSYPTAGVAMLAQRFDAVRVMSPGATESLDPFRVKLKTFA